MSSKQTVSLVSVDAEIEKAKLELRTLFSSAKQIILRLGQAFEQAIEPSIICSEIKRVLNKEIGEGIVSGRQIERNCPDKWKQSTKPKKNDKMSFLDNGKLITSPGNQKIQITRVVFKAKKHKFLEILTAVKNSSEYCGFCFDHNLELAVVRTDRVN